MANAPRTTTTVAIVVWALRREVLLASSRAGDVEQRDLERLPDQRGVPERLAAGGGAALDVGDGLALGAGDELEELPRPLGVLGRLEDRPPIHPGAVVHGLLAAGRVGPGGDAPVEVRDLGVLVQEAG